MGAGALGAAGALAADDGQFATRAMRISTLSLRLNDLVTGLEWLERAAAASPTDVRVLASLADVQIRAGNRAAAQVTIAQGLDHDPTNTTFLALARRAR